MSISVRVIDCTHGVAATDVQIVLRYRVDSEWRDVTHGATGEDGRLSLLTGECAELGVYRLEFDLDGYYALLGIMPTYPRAIIEFRVTDQTNEFDMPLMMTSNSLLTYRI